MAGRAGRRGMDVRGFVLYAPTLSVAGERNRCPANELEVMLTGSMPSVESQLAVEETFVLRHLGKGFGAEILETTLLHDQLCRQSDALRAGSSVSAKLSTEEFTSEFEAAVDRYDLQKSRVEGTTGDLIRLNPKQRKQAEKEMREIAEKWGSVEEFEKKRDRFHEHIKAEKEIIACQTQLRTSWDQAYDWLYEMGFIEWNQAGSAVPGQKLTARGYACAAFSDGHPLILGTVVADRGLENLSAAEIFAWLCMFLREGRSKDCAGGGTERPVPSAALRETLDYTHDLAKQLGVELDEMLTTLMLDWCANKDLMRISIWIEPALLGTFVKAVMRVVSYIDVLKEVVLGLGFYEVHNRLDNHQETLLGGLVTNESLYLSMADEKVVQEK